MAECGSPWLGMYWGGVCGVSLTSSRSSLGLLFSAGVFLPPGFRYVCVCVALVYLVLCAKAMCTQT